jgi:hypothetical protein
MPTELTLNKLSAKYLVDWLAKHGWGVGADDLYLAGELLADVLPTFGEGPGEIKVPEVPRVSTLNKDGSVDWSRMTKAEIDDYQKRIGEYNQAFGKWAREPLPDPENPDRARIITITDKQLAVCQKMIRYFAPRSEEDRAKDREKQQPPREELPANEYTFRLLKQLKLGAA